MSYLPSSSTLKKYGMTADEWSSLYIRQQGLCPICGKQLRGMDNLGKRPAIDHDHHTGQVRGLLCVYPCNYVLGYLKDRADLFQACSDYLLNPPAYALMNKTVPKRKRRKKKRASH